MTEPVYGDPALVALYDELNPWGVEEDFFADMAGPAALRVLDLGCGTGRLARHLAAAGHPVVGVDPASAMLAAARRQQSRVEWIEADARTVRLGRRFDRILSTGHVFQVFQADADQCAYFATLAAHLERDGRFSFDNRNPLRREWREWSAAGETYRVDHPEHGPVDVRYEATDPDADGVLRLTTIFRYVGQGRERRAESCLRFTDREALLRRLGECGLRVIDLFGNWDRSPCRDDSPEIIVLGGLA